VESAATGLGVFGQQPLYRLVGLLCLFWLKHGEGEDESAMVRRLARERYNLAALQCLLLFWDNLLRRIEGGTWEEFWLSSGRLEVVVLFGILSLLA
jgi:hypothetical protein